MADRGCIRDTPASCPVEGPPSHPFSKVIPRPTTSSVGAAMGETRDSIADVWGDRTPFEGEWPARVDERTTAKPERWVQSACVLCSNGCALDIGVRGGKI